MRTMVILALALLLSAGSAIPTTPQSTLKATDSQVPSDFSYFSLLEQTNVPIEVPYQDIDE